MGKVRMILGIVVLVLLFVFALFNSGSDYVSNVRFFIKSWTIPEVPVWGIIYIAVILGVIIGCLFRGGRKPKKTGEG